MEPTGRSARLVESLRRKKAAAGLDSNFVSTDPSTPPFFSVTTSVASTDLPPLSVGLEEGEIAETARLLAVTGLVPDEVDPGEGGSAEDSEQGLETIDQVDQISAVSLTAWQSWLQGSKYVARLSLRLDLTNVCLEILELERLWASSMKQAEGNTRSMRRYWGPGASGVCAHTVT